MPSRKQRRRREKLQRHDYEYVVETEEGEEVAVERARELEKRKATGRDGRADQKGPVDRRGRPIPKPSLQRVLKRTAIFAPILVLFVFFMAPQLSTVQKAFQAVILLAFFIPFSYTVDVLVYRLVTRRYAQQQARRR